MTPQTVDQLRTPADQGERVAKSFKDYEHEGWNSKASQYERLFYHSRAKGSNQF